MHVITYHVGDELFVCSKFDLDAGLTFVFWVKRYIDLQSFWLWGWRRGGGERGLSAPALRTRFKNV